jgi:hypothetical protein
MKLVVLVEFVFAFGGLNALLDASLLDNHSHFLVVVVFLLFAFDNLLDDDDLP